MKYLEDIRGDTIRLVIVWTLKIIYPNIMVFCKGIVPNNLLKNILIPIWDDIKHINTIDIFENVLKHKSQISLKLKNM